MLFASLGSGSAGNGLIIRAPQSEENPPTTLLIDCGFNLREVQARLARLDLSPTELTAVVVTHEHEDHAGGVERLARRYQLPVFMTHGTFQAIRWRKTDELNIHLIDNYSPFCIGQIAVEPYPVPHDAREPAQFVFTFKQKRLGLLTDAGCQTPHLTTALSGLDGIVLECNHDRELLARSEYPYRLKQRIGGPMGHLSNCTAAAILEDIIHPKLQHVVAAHLSQQNNTPEHAQAMLAPVVERVRQTLQASDFPRLHIACQEAGFGWLELV